MSFEQCFSQDWIQEWDCSDTLLLTTCHSASAQWLWLLIHSSDSTLQSFTRAWRDCGSCVIPLAVPVTAPSLCRFKAQARTIGCHGTPCRAIRIITTWQIICQKGSTPSFETPSYPTFHLMNDRVGHRKFAQNRRCNVSNNVYITQ